MKPIEFHLITITPVFMAGEDGKRFELRPPSFKGLLRFWWRAAYWGQSHDKLSLEKIQIAEGNIFGTAARDGCKSRFAIRLSPTQFNGSKDPLPYHKILGQRQGRTFSLNILNYLAYGTYDFKSKTFNREYLKQEQPFTLKLMPSNETVVKEIVTSVYFLLVFGGVGAKSRNGFGSLAVTNPKIFANYNLPYPFPDKEFLKTQVALNPNLPPFTAFSTKSDASPGMKIFKLESSQPTWDKCLAELGIIYREARGKLEPRHQYEKRQYISAPIVTRSGTESLSERHAKPYFLRVVKRADGKFDGYILYLPSKYSEGVPQKGGTEQEHTNKFLKYCDEFNIHLAAQMGVYYG